MRCCVSSKKLEENNRGEKKPLNIKDAPATGGVQLSFFQLDDPVLCQVRDEILNVDIDNLTPMQALNKLNDIKKIITGKD